MLVKGSRRVRVRARAKARARAIGVGVGEEGKVGIRLQVLL